MTSEQLISGKEFCVHHHIEMHFLQSLHQFGLIEITTVDNDCLLQPDQLSQIERMMRLHFDLQVNFEGIDVIQNLLQQLDSIQNEMHIIKSRLRVYEQPQ